MNYNPFYKSFVQSSFLYLTFIVIYSIGRTSGHYDAYIYSEFEHLGMLVCSFPIYLKEPLLFARYRTSSYKNYIEVTIDGRLKFILFYALIALIMKMIVMFMIKVECPLVIYLYHALLIFYELGIISVLFSLFMILPSNKYRYPLSYFYIAIMLILLLTNSKYSLFITPVIIPIRYFDLEIWWFLINALFMILYIAILYRMILRGDYDD